jgi:hypothetical protein
VPTQKQVTKKKLEKKNEIAEREEKEEEEAGTRGKEAALCSFFCEYY